MTSIIQIVGYKNSGKTTLTAHLVGALTQAGCKVGTIKHDGHRFDIDQEGTDTWRHREAGASMTAITSSERTVVMEEKSSELDAIIRRMLAMDAIIVEGFKEADYPKVVMIRSAEDVELVHRLRQVIAVVTWAPALSFPVPTFSIHQTDQLVAWLMPTLSR
ncbi:molybdopterin-guanine dinucleotide biosynthesis protein B [Paenibacillus cellulosilyticus]|uniref:Molybdopterin-guanine dinucleotide biosynthesis protein B n=1 Tax=Paenibacillus cellulosilyticus TaxID=375489 RepID=A0A2V2YQX4_9BACL|nr:molybdopterin-guanine dinucleotide biosynthesis protein B [Paenibacillus cellulosilyticus]PWV98443.1 molybdopterin-guanine dinucleotide biosynthesis protein B [Paenibacillus cellulosilyticus]QKS43287.1 molybdopterin-guanine dinucleotide biosynthesis protein B [Paenibacillus cellulosilyticus]